MISEERLEIWIEAWAARYLGWHWTYEQARKDTVRPFPPYQTAALLRLKKLVLDAASLNDEPPKGKSVLVADAQTSKDVPTGGEGREAAEEYVRKQLVNMDGSVEAGLGRIGYERYEAVVKDVMKAMILHGGKR